MLTDQTHNKHIRVDDDDGHFIVNAGTMITTRCEYNSPLCLVFDLTFQILSSNCSVRAHSVRSSRPMTILVIRGAPSKSFGQYKSTGMLRGLSSVCSAHLPKTTRPTATDASICAIASTTAATFASSPTCSAKVCLTFSRRTPLCRSRVHRSKVLPANSSPALPVSVVS